MPKLITDLAIMLLTAGVVAVLFKRLKLPLVLGYILAGFLVGPYMPYFFTVADQSSIETWSEIGIIVLMFGLGLEFNLHKLASVGAAAIVTAMTEVFGMLALGYLTGQALGWSMMDSIFLGGMLSMSSTTIIIKAFCELGVRQEGFAQLVFGTLVIEDIAGIFMMIILSTLSVSKNISGGELALQLGMLVLYLALWLILGIYILPTLLRKAERFLNDETLLLASLGVCFGMVLLAERLGFSSALGAFLAGSLMAGTIHAERVEHLSSGVRDLFGSIFFLSVGMLIDPSMILRYWLPILIVTIVTIVGKLIISSLGVLLSGQGLNKAVRCGSSLAQIGEFAFIIASLGMSLGVIADYIYPIVVSVSVITTLTTPFFIKNSEKLYVLIRRALPKKLAEKLDRYASEDEGRGSLLAGSDWLRYLRRYVRVTALYGVLITGVILLGQYVLQPLLQRTPLDERPIRWVCSAFILVGTALFVRPMLDLHSTEYTTLWVKDRLNRLPLLTLTALRCVLIVFLVFLPLQDLLKIGGVWLLVALAAVIFFAERSGWLASAYISAEAQFMANFNERSLQRTENGESAEWLDEKLFVQSLEVTAAQAEKSLKQLDWGSRFSVNVVQIRRGRRRMFMPSGNVELREGDTLLLVGRSEDLRSLRMSLGLDEAMELPTLRAFTEAQEDETNALYATAIPVTQGSELAGRSIRGCGLREKYDCMILGLQRERLPILQPDVNMTIQQGDLVWVLGTRKMAEKLLAGGFGEE